MHEASKRNMYLHVYWQYGKLSIYPHLFYCSYAENAKNLFGLLSKIMFRYHLWYFQYAVQLYSSLKTLLFFTYWGKGTVTKSVLPEPGSGPTYPTPEIQGSMKAICYDISFSDVTHESVW